MGFELFVACFENGAPAGVPLASVKNLFPVIDEASTPDYWTVRYGPTDSCTISVTTLESEPEMVSGICVERPCAHPDLWNDLVSLLRLGSLTLFFPGDAPPLIANLSVSRDLPSDIVDSLGEPLVVSTGSELAELVRTG